MNVEEEEMSSSSSTTPHFERNAEALIKIQAIWRGRMVRKTILQARFLRQERKIQQLEKNKVHSFFSGV